MNVVHCKILIAHMLPVTIAHLTSHYKTFVTYKCRLKLIIKHYFHSQQSIPKYVNEITGIITKIVFVKDVSLEIGSLNQLRISS